MWYACDAHGGQPLKKGLGSPVSLWIQLQNLLRKSSQIILDILLLLFQTKQKDA